jgi:hypothetical protein
MPFCTLSFCVTAGTQLQNGHSILRAFIGEIDAAR